jgi:tRNA:m(5)U-54 methyltransferase
LLACAEEAAVPAGSALAVDRDLFAQKVTKRIEEHPKITLIREESQGNPGPAVHYRHRATHRRHAGFRNRRTGRTDHLFFYDAIAPLVQAETIDMDIAFRASRYARGLESDSDYINCPLTEEEYVRFVEALKSAERIALHAFEQEDPNFFEGCLPVEQLAARDDKALAFGPMRPVGLKDPRTGRRPYAVVQLRQDNLAGSLYNLVGFQTNLRWSEQSRVFRMIPGLQNAEFARFGQMHRNTFVNSRSRSTRRWSSERGQACFSPDRSPGSKGTSATSAPDCWPGSMPSVPFATSRDWSYPHHDAGGALSLYCPRQSHSLSADEGQLRAVAPSGAHVPTKAARYVALTRRAEQALSELIASGEDDLIQA